MDIKVEQKGNIKTIKVNGRILVMDIKDLEKELENLSNVKELRIDLTETKYADSSFLGLVIHTKGKHPEMELKMINPNEFLLALFDIPDFKGSFTIVHENK
jgi:ABC-type transporter Mla MlaB component